METTIKELKSLKEGYVLFSLLTNMPYVECETENYNDESFLFAGKEDAETMVKALDEKGIRTVARELKTLEVQVPVKQDKPQGEQKKMYLNQVRQHLGTMPFLGINAVCYQPAGGQPVLVELSELLPEDFEKKVSGNALYQPTLQLTGLYLMQEARRRKEYVDMKHLQELDEEFSSNLVKSRLFIPVLAPEGHEKDPKLDLKSCKMPYLRHQNGDIFFPLFTDVWEFQKYAQGKKGLRPVQVPFQEITKFWVKDAKAYMINPMGYSLPIGKDMIPRILQKFGVSENPS